MAPPRRNPANNAEETLHNLAMAIRDQVMTTNQILQHLQNANNLNRVNGANNRMAGNDNGISEFLRTSPPCFQGGFDPIVAERWIRELEKIFEVMGCTEEQQVIFAAYMLKDEAEYWWRGARELLAHQGRQITWQVFKDTFLEKYFPSTVRAEKEIEFLQLR